MDRPEAIAIIKDRIEIDSAWANEYEGIKKELELLEVCLVALEAPDKIMGKLEAHIRRYGNQDVYVGLLLAMRIIKEVLNDTL